MSKSVALTCTAVALFLTATGRDQRFIKYKPVEAYEVHPGVLMMPKYTADRQVCEIVIEKDHYSNGTADLDSAVPHDVVNEIVDELAPASERGPLTTNPEMARLSIYAGNTVTSFLDYSNVSVDISRLPSSTGDIVAVIKWKHRQCK